MSELRRDELLGTWIHSHEEDQAGERVYRREDYEFPPARGRDGFALRDDGSAELLGPGADDVPSGAEARWSLDEREIAISGAPGSARLIVSALEPGRLVVSDLER